MHHLPPWLARPAVLLSTLAALGGSALICAAAATGDYRWAIWGLAAFVGAAALWYLSDLVAAPGPGGPP